MKTWTSVALPLILNGAASAQTVVWEASLTVEESGTYTGYDAAGGYGALSNTRFRGGRACSCGWPSTCCSF